MRVAMYYNNHDVRIEEMPKPEISADEVLLKVKASGICGSDVMEWYRIKKAPLVLGHEATGEISEVGANVKKYKAGDRIFVSHHVPCNSCRYCLNGDHTVCQTLHTTNYFPGGFSEYIRIPQINVERGIINLPENVSFEDGTFIEPLACVLRGQKMIQVKPGQTIMIIGAGISGLLHLILGRINKAEKIFISDINPYRLKVAQGLGADAVVDAKEDVPAQLLKLNNNRLADLVIVCASSPKAFQQAMQCVDRAGAILCFTAPEPGVEVSVPINDFWRKSIRILHSYGASPSDLSEATGLLHAKKIPVKSLITHRLELNEAAQGFKLVAEAKDCIKVILEPDKN